MRYERGLLYSMFGSIAVAYYYIYTVRELNQSRELTFCHHHASHRVDLDIVVALYD
jgi:hypothetical protein